jgi:predicted nucleic acid-binding protein
VKSCQPHSGRQDLRQSLKSEPLVQSDENAMKTEIAFWDTSALVPLCCAQAGPASRSRGLFRHFKKPVVWWATPVEIRSALVRLKQDGDLTDHQVGDAIRKWEMLELTVREVNPTERVRGLARAIPERYQLRTLDSFQLAAALVWCQEQPRRRPFICFDARLGNAAESAGFVVHRLES